MHFGLVVLLQHRVNARASPNPIPAIVTNPVRNQTSSLILPGLRLRLRLRQPPTQSINKFQPRTLSYVGLFMDMDMGYGDLRVVVSQLPVQPSKQSYQYCPLVVTQGQDSRTRREGEEKKKKGRSTVGSGRVLFPSPLINLLWFVSVTGSALLRLDSGFGGACLGVSYSIWACYLL
ncbi:hypothetical protein P168DRAFT_278121 [Aspergillus campestris IBT 28561]|uniref:Uncharacterized protein n=1 Tax=Aspergillus campestris (strain IBT 28561) TaxID=1392248 RepID=A0A2I1DF93_ASPC2|nr:uncharacterized protein P168DRAFT_278121 [Aspergillus campestris IBT 28561]PKY08544.1 hypothetical protein P168DRAFT_278121 [Aspergillus campestris IBT 28561]